ncbi:DUF2750 domain-containing protein [Ferrimonas aestuarii]|uniref:DUF2750 domain-containing protein n=1 Tax=Ferrimonas aestuarii TaxID=2569539 RepID=A0A4U1BRH4_9GAMM|nr:DUF2750 domain-containing protein [Ferrimonas aestuarii]TKB57370.1 DUF2750 domain-containing protein [Ferrimonas aestuarii]
MSDAIPHKEIDAMNAEERLQYLLKTAAQTRKLWLLIDEYGSVMFNTDDEEGVPVWPHEELALAWATDEWKHCRAEAISTAKWHSRWTRGLEDDQLAVIAFPHGQEEGVVLFPEEFDFELSRKENKAR